MALPVASGMLLVVSILVVGFFTVSLRVNETSVEDRGSKRALAAAEAGLQTAVFRLNQLSQSASANSGSCLTTTWVAPGLDGECAALTEQLGNGAQYRYVVTPEGSAAGCTELPGEGTDQDRCITTIGTAGGVSRRIQTRVIQRPIVPTFGTVGLVGKSLVYAWNSVNLKSDVGSNVLVDFENSINVDDNSSIEVDGNIYLLEGGTYNEGNSVNVDGNGGNPVAITEPFELPVPDFEPFETNNNNANLVTDLGTAWNATTRRIDLTSGTKTIRPGTYHTCGVKLGDSVNLAFSHAGNVATRIFVDSPDRPGSFCAGQADPAGTFGADNSVRINSANGQREELLEIYMYGTTKNDTRAPYSWCESGSLPAECRSDFMLDNSVDFYGNVYAPNSSVQAHNSVNIYGSVAADRIRFFNSINFQLTGPSIDERQILVTAAENKGWSECQAQPTVAADPESGCT